MNTRTLILAIAMIACMGDEASASDEPPSTPWPAPPFEAWVAADVVYVMPQLGRYWPTLAILQYGDVVRVTGCDPSCGAPNAWAQLAPFGVVRLSNLRATPRDRAGEFLAGTPDFTWARVRYGGVVARAAPSPDAEVVERFGRDEELIFRNDAALLATGYVERPTGGFVATSSLTVFEASTFAGWRDPPAHFAFVRADTTLTLADGTTRPVSRYERFAVLTTTRDRVIVADGSLPRRAVRLGEAIPRPPRVRPNTRWTHVDLSEQVLTAYDGDRLVFATLVSTGRRAGTTRTGTFEVRRKITYVQMRGGGRDPYSVEGVPWVLYFDGAIALHGAFWHDGFGAPRSHGCVNLSPADARFMFDFAPPELPDGWRSVNPQALRTETLTVVIAD